MRSIDNVPRSVELRGRIGDREAVVRAERRRRRHTTPAAAHLRRRRGVVAGHVLVFVAMVALAAVFKGKGLPHHAVRIVAARDAAILLAEAVRVALNVGAECEPR